MNNWETRNDAGGTYWCSPLPAADHTGAQVTWFSKGREDGCGCGDAKRFAWIATHEWCGRVIGIERLRAVVDRAMGKSEEVK